MPVGTAMRGVLVAAGATGVGDVSGTVGPAAVVSTVQSVGRTEPRPDLGDDGTEDDVVVASVEHGRRLHNMTPTREEVIARAVPDVDPAVRAGADRRLFPETDATHAPPGQCRLVPSAATAAPAAARLAQSLGASPDLAITPQPGAGDET